ncbi:MAG: sugar kinase [Bacteroidota bacterium]
MMKQVELTSIKYDLLAVGELLVDLIGEKKGVSLQDNERFVKYAGGSPANLASNLAKLGKSAALVACVGKDGLGRFLKEELNKAGVMGHVSTHETLPTSMVLTTRSTETPDFIAYRSADPYLPESELSDEILSQTKIFHTTCFALSRSPAREIILEAAQRAHQLGVKLSIDLNYAPEIWPERKEAQEIISHYCQWNPLIKMSEVDAKRIFARQGRHQLAGVNHLKKAGAALICMTLGKEGSRIFASRPERIIEVPVPPVSEVADSTGAGDAYWAGFLCAWIDQKDLEICAQAGSRLAAFKVQTFGPLPKEKEYRIYEDE